MGIWEGYLSMMRDVSKAKKGFLGDEQEEARRRRAEIGQGLLGNVESVSGSMRSAEFDPQGNEINVQETLQPTTQQYGGFLGSNQTAEDQARLNMGLLNAGYSTQDVAAVSKPFELRQTRADAAASAALEQGLMVGEFANRKDQLAANRAMAGDFKKEIQPYKDKTQYYDDTQALGSIENWTGTDDFIAMRNLLKQSLPNESVMGDDLNNLTIAGGLKGKYQEMKGWLLEGGEKGKQARENLMTTMHSNAVQARGYGDDIRTNYKAQADSVEGLNSDYMLPVRPIKPLTLKETKTPSPTVQNKGESDQEYMSRMYDLRKKKKKKSSGQMGRRKR